MHRKAISTVLKKWATVRIGKLASRLFTSQLAACTKCSVRLVTVPLVRCNGPFIFRSQTPQSVRLFNTVRLFGFYWYPTERVRISSHPGLPSQVHGLRLCRYQQIWNYRKYGIIAKMFKIFRILKGSSLSRNKGFKFSLSPSLKILISIFCVFFSISNLQQCFRVQKLFLIGPLKMNKYSCQ